MTRIIVALIFSILLSATTFAAHHIHASDGFNLRPLEKITGTKAEYNDDDHSIKIIAPRNDISLTLNGIKYAPAQGLSSWIQFKKSDDQLTAVGDLVLTENQVNAVISTALHHNIRVTALVNHSMWEEPRVMYMHIETDGKPAQVTRNITKVFAEIAATKNGHDNLLIAQVDPAEAEIIGSEINTHRINRILDTHGVMKDGVYKITIGKTARNNNHHTDDVSGVNTWAAITGTERKAVIDGNLAIHQYQLQTVLSALRKANLDILAIDNHASHDQQDYVFLHFYGIGHANALARGLRAALNVADKTEDTAARKAEENKTLSAAHSGQFEIGYCSTDGITTNVVPSSSQDS